MAGSNSELLARYARQVVFPGLGIEGQRLLRAGRVLVVGVGGLGSWAAELLVRAGVGFLRLVDDDRVELVNLHRQALYGEADALWAAPKVTAARERIGQISSRAKVEPVIARLNASNIETLAAGMDLIVDGTDNFAARYVINDYSLKAGIPWVFAGVIQAEGQVMAVVPGRTACLRCILETPPPPCEDPNCRTAGILGPAAAAIASVQAIEAIKILSGRIDRVSACLLKMDFWSNSVQRIEVPPRPDCPCCGRHDYEFLEP
jgi:adenylyltransferase/sulfurtransferase